MQNRKLIKTAVILVDICLVLLAVCTVALPWGVTWYVETMGRSQKLPAIIMVTSYPCVPFAAAMLYFLRRLLKNISRGRLLESDSMRCCNRVSELCLAMAVITVIAGRFYLPFFIIGIALAFMALLVFIFKTAFMALGEPAPQTGEPEASKASEEAQAPESPVEPEPPATEEETE